jgi:lipoprotein-releasing system permease protein
MNISQSWFIAKRLTKETKGGFTSLILRICIATTSVSLAVMIIAMSLINGFQLEITNKIYHFWGHITITDVNITQDYSPIPITSDSIELNSILSISNEDIGIKEYNDLVFTSAQGFILYPGILKKNNDLEGIQLKGVDGQFNPVFFDNYLVRGEAPGWLQSSENGSRDILLSEYTANRLMLAVGDSLDIYFLKNNNQLVRRFKLCGIYKTGLEEYDKKVGIIYAGILQQLLGWNFNQFSGYELFVKDVSIIDRVSDYLLEQILPIQYLPIGIRSRFPAIFEWLDLQDYNRVLILTLMILVCVFNISTAVIVLIIERKRMVGILKTLGMPFLTLQSIFIILSMRIVLQSLIIGNSLGLLICYLQDKYRFIALNESDYYLSYAPVTIPWISFFLLNFVFVVLIFLVLLIPLNIIQRINIVKVLNYS